LHPETPEQGSTLDELFAGRGLDIPRMLAHLKQTADELGLPFGRRTMTYNSRRAQELGKWAEEQGCGEAFHRAAFHAYFAEGQNIARIEVLRRLAHHIELNADPAEEVLNAGRYKEAVDQDWQRARQLGIHAVPTFQIHGRILVGAQKYKSLEQLINSSS
jgi:predicted DsbA family dithiol-disulfide isomerase